MRVKNQPTFIAPPPDDNIRTTGQIADHDDHEKHHYTKKVIAFAFFKSWEKLPSRAASLLAHVLPVLINRAPDEHLAVGIGLPNNLPAEPNTDRRKEFKSLVRTARKLNRAKVRCLWWSPNEDHRPDQTYRRHTVELTWTTEVRVNPAIDRIDLVFWEGMRPVLPHLARMAGVGNKIATGDFEGTVMEVADNDSLELYLRKNRR